MNAILIAFATFLSAIFAQQCGSDLGVCPNNLCCSSFGFCGNTSMHCGPGCLSGACLQTPIPASYNQTYTSKCNATGPFCPPNLCCSSFGECGSTDMHCGTGCVQGNCLTGPIGPKGVFQPSHANTTANATATTSDNATPLPSPKGVINVNDGAQNDTSSATAFGPYLLTMSLFSVVSILFL